ncbi:MAG TPA: methyltransferase domain-containing protein [bacterium]|jgi:SAM-dependent methyltransferase|nr:methyltransferase domain-containing protein [bacterium]
MKFLYQLLEIPIVYRIVSFILGPGGAYLRGKINRKVFNPPFRKALDVGCGPLPTTPEPLELLVGLDVNEDYIKQYTGGYIDTDPSLVLNPPAARRRLGYLASATQMPFADGAFDEVRSTSFFHHMSDGESEKTLKEMFRCIHSGGRLILFDAVKPKRAWTRPVSWFVAKFDRGRYFRTEQELVALFQKALPGDWHWKRYTYTFSGLEFLCLQYVKK